MPGRDLILDTNLVLLLLVARTDKSLLSRYKRVGSFEHSDFAILETLITSRRSICSTPHVLAEVSNLLGPYRSVLLRAYRSYVKDCEEHWHRASMLAGLTTFDDLGLTDTALANLSLTYQVVTTDFALALRIAALGGNAINFNNLRSARLLSARS